MNDKIIGIHINSDIKELLGTLEKANKMKCKIVQLFVDSNINNTDLYEKARDYLKSHNMVCSVHGSYTINIAKSWSEYDWWIQQCINEIEIAANKLNAIVYVLHIGKQLKLSKEECYNNMYTSLLHIHDATKHLNIKILLETSSGQGSELCHKIEDLSYFYRKFSKHNNEKIRNRIKICLDTCHIFAAGYDINSKNNISIYLDNFNELVGLENIGLIHLNDSKQGLGSNKDRHENIGKGFIGKKSLKIIAEIFSNLNIPIVLETPDEKMKDDLNILIEK